MTNKDYAEIQRKQGLIEGLVADASNIIFDGVYDAVETIDKILEKEMESENSPQSMMKAVLNNGKSEQDH